MRGLGLGLRTRGLSAPGTNLLVKSQAFDDAAWSKVAVTVTADAAAAPGGSVSADKIIPSTGDTLHYFHQAVTTASAIYTYSHYAKADGYGWLFVEITDQGGASRRTYWNASTGAVGTVGAGCTAAIEDVGGGWYRCKLTYTARPVSDVIYIGIAAADGGNNFAGNGVGGILFYGAQLEPGTTAGRYRAT